MTCDFYEELDQGKHCAASLYEELNSVYFRCKHG